MAHEDIKAMVELSRRLAKAADALRPFAEWADAHDKEPNWVPDNYPLAGPGSFGTLKAGHCRAAREALRTLGVKP